MSTCRSCSHTKFAHQHHRRGTDCSGCDCPKFRALPMPFARLFKRRPQPELRVQSQPAQKPTVAA